MTSIGESAFYDCSGLGSVTIPSSVTSIGDYAFYFCSRLKSVTIPSSVTNIGWEAFYGCSGLGSVTIPLGVTSIGNWAFSGCSGLKSVTIPLGVTSIGDSAFSGCSGLTSVTIPSSVTSIGWGAFYGCWGLTSVTIPPSVTSIGEGAFLDCNGLTSVTVDKGDTERMKGLLEVAGVDMSKITFIEREPPVMDDPVATIPVEEGAAYLVSYPELAAKAGGDVEAFLRLPTGKVDANGNAMQVWQDVVAGTNPEDKDDRFEARIEFVDGKVKVTYSPELDEARKALRRYVTRGKKELTDAEWVVVPEGKESESGCKYFTVTVEMVR